MADKTVADLPNDAPTSASLFEHTNAVGNSRHCTGTQLKSYAGGGETVISTTTTASSAASVTISSIPGTYRHLKLRVFGRSNLAGADNDTILLQFNGDTASNYTWNRDGAADAGSAFTSGSTSATAITAAYIPAATSTAGFAGIMEMLIPFYTNTTFKKTGWGGNTGKGGGGVYQMNIGWSWASTSAITSILVDLPGSNTFVDGTIVELIGIA